MALTLRAFSGAGSVTQCARGIHTPGAALNPSQTELVHQYPSFLGLERDPV